MTRTRRSAVLLPLALAALAGCTDRPDPLAPTGVPDRPSHLLVPDGDFEQLTAGFAHTCALRSNGSVVCWGIDAEAGSNYQGQTVVPADLGAVAQVSAGNLHTCAVTDDGSVVCWGDMNVPADLGAVTQVGTGRAHTCAVKVDRTVDCWGGNDLGQTEVPPGLSDVVQLSLGDRHTCVVRSDEHAVCWGASFHTVPADLGAVTQVSAGESHTCAVKRDDTVACWGGGPTAWYTAVPAGLSNVVEVSAGNVHNCALTDGGAVVCWGVSSGLNDYGQADVPANLGVVTHVTAGEYHTCALRSDRTAVCWGNNAYGQSDAPATRIDPVAGFHASPGSVVAGEPFILSLENAQVPGYTGPVTFSYAFDCGDGSGYGPFSSSATATCPTTVIGTRNVRGTVRDQDGDDREYTATVEASPYFAFSGFLAPVRSDVLNQVKAGQGVPIRFSLGGDHGLEIFGAQPSSSLIDCDVTGGTSDVAENATAGKSSLSYDPATQIYTWVWKTQKGWGTSCRRLELQLADGQVWAADFHFSR